jgi:anti-anti-sigma factor
VEVEPMDFVVEQDADHRFRVSGEVDMATAQQLFQLLEPAVRSGGEIRVDVSAMTFLDSVGLQTLAALGKRCVNGDSIVIEGATGQVAKLFEIVGADMLPNLVIRWDGARTAR